MLLKKITIITRDGNHELTFNLKEKEDIYFLNFLIGDDDVAVVKDPKHTSLELLQYFYEIDFFINQLEK